MVDEDNGNSIRIGGLFRCCIDTVDKQADDNPHPQEGDVLNCLHCEESVIYRRGAWEWNRA